MLEIILDGKTYRIYVDVYIVKTGNFFQIITLFIIIVI